MPATEAERTFLSVSILKMALGDEKEAFLQVFKLTAEGCGWPPIQWALRLLPLLMGEGLATAHAFPVTACSSYLDLHRALQDCLGLKEEGHRRQLRET